jgi:hypothetical protein
MPRSKNVKSRPLEEKKTSKADFAVIIFRAVGALGAILKFFDTAWSWLQELLKHLN